MRVLPHRDVSALQIENFTKESGKREDQLVLWNANTGPENRVTVTWHCIIWWGLCLYWGVVLCEKHSTYLHEMFNFIGFEYNFAKKTWFLWLDWVPSFTYYRLKFFSVFLLNPSAVVQDRSMFTTFSVYVNSWLDKTIVVRCHLPTGISVHNIFVINRRYYFYTFSETCKFTQNHWGGGADRHTHRHKERHITERLFLLASSMEDMRPLFRDYEKSEILNSYFESLLFHKFLLLFISNNLRWIPPPRNINMFVTLP
jgi:hypothetical protein